MKRILLTLGMSAFLAGIALDARSIDADASTFNSNNFSIRSIIGEDSRVRVVDTTMSPYNSTVFIAADGAAGSGAVIGENTVLTAAHVVKKIVDKLDKKSVYVIPGRDGAKLPYGKFKIESVHIPQSYIDKPSVDRDIAILTIKPLDNKGIGEVVPPLPVKLSNSVVIGEPLQTSGYPGDKKWGTLWKTQGSVIKETNTRIYYDLDTFGGQSGSPVYNSSNEIIAVHTTGAGNSNFGTKINDEFYHFICKYLS